MSTTITIDRAIDLLRDGRGRYDGTTHTDLHGYAAIVTDCEACATHGVLDVSPGDVDRLVAAAEHAAT